MLNAIDINEFKNYLTWEIEKIEKTIEELKKDIEKNSSSLKKNNAIIYQLKVIESLASHLDIETLIEVLISINTIKDMETDDYLDFNNYNCSDEQFYYLNTKHSVIKKVLFDLKKISDIYSL